jgi:DNA-binding response OmpR family regulator
MAQERILVVDGDLELSSLLKSRLEAMDYLVDCARNGNEALEMLKSEWVDLILMDVVLKGGINGFQLFKKIKKKKEYSQIPVIVQSSKVDMKKTFELLGAESFFIKPYAVEVLLDEIKDLLSKKILVLGDRGPALDSLVKILSAYDLHIDILHKLNNFYYNVISYRYGLIVLQYKMKPNMTDRILSIIRGSSKNKEAPVIIYMPEKLSDLDEKEGRKLLSLKERCRALELCELMEKGYSPAQFRTLAKKHLELF